MPLIVQQKVDNGLGLELVDGSETVYGFLNSSGQVVTNITSRGPYPYKFYRDEITWNTSGNRIENLRVEQGYIFDYDLIARKPTTYFQDGWAAQNYTWNADGLLTSSTFEDFTSSYEYSSGTYLLTKQTAIDGQVTDYRYDELMRPKTISARDDNVTTTYNYHFTSGGSDKNYTRTLTEYTPIVNSGSNLTEIENRQYFDGLGRLVQTVNKQASPDNKDVVVGLEYDDQGNPWKQYNLIESSFSDGRYLDIPSNTEATETTYEDSPLNRPITVTPPDWYASSISYETNTTPINYAPGLSSTYPIGSLYQKSVTDPDNKVTTTYTDKRGRTVMTDRHQGSNTAKTYNEYDDKDRPLRITPPDATVSQSNLLFRNFYDGRDNLIQQHIPDKDPVQMWYDSRDLPVAMQDGKMLGESRYLLTDYDAYGRNTTTGFDANLPSDLNNIVIPVDSCLTQTFYDGNSDIPSQVIDPTNTPQYFGRVRQTKTRVLEDNEVGTDWLISILSYNSYGQLGNVRGNNHLTGDETTDLYYDFADNLTLSQRRHNLDNQSPNVNIHQQQQYDHQGRKIASDHILNGNSTRICEVVYNHKSLVTAKKIGKVGTSFLQEVDYSYNEQDWLTDINNVLLPGNDLFSMRLRYDVINSAFSSQGFAANQNGNISEITYRTTAAGYKSVGYQYDFLDRLTETSDGHYVTNVSINIDDEYKSTYSYDLRGNMQTLTRRGLRPEDASFGGMDDLTYEYKNNSNQINLITDEINTSCTQNHILAGAQTTPQTYEADQTITSTQTISNNANVNYLAGQSILMEGGFCVALGTEFLADIQPCRSDLAGFIDGTGTYDYDENGNMTHDPDKGIDIKYNYLNLPYLITFDDGKWIGFLYDANGQKLRKTTSAGLVQDYVSGIEYKNGNLEAIYHEEGRAIPDGNSFEYQYALKDHLGNTRVMFSDDGNGVAELLSENHFYAFGLQMNGLWNQQTNPEQNYLFTGFERQHDFGLNLDMAQFRTYDSATGRWLQIDPLASEFASWSPYSYSFNNPVKYIDKSGLAPEDCCPGDGPTPTVAGILYEGFQNMRSALFNMEMRVAEAFGYGDGNTSTRMRTNYDANGGISTSNPVNIGQEAKKGALAEAGDIALDALSFTPALELGAARGMNGAFLAARTLGGTSSLRSLSLASKFEGQALPSNYMAESLNFSVNNQVVSVGGNDVHGTYAFIINSSGDLKLGNPRQGVHYSLSEGASSVRAAGQLQFNNGRIVGVNNFSGHYPVGNTVNHTEDVLDVLEGNNLINMQTRAFGNGAMNFSSGY